MKRFIPALLLFFIQATGFSQATDTIKPNTKEYYLQKSKHQRTTGWILTGGGAALMITGVSLLSANILVDNPNSQKVKNRETTGLVLLSAGTIALTGGIINLIAAKRNEKRAMKIRIQQLNSWIQQNKTLREIYYPAVTLSLVI